MADQPVTREKLINADIDVDNLGKAVNEEAIVSPRYGTPYKSLPMIAREYDENSGTKGFNTLAEFEAVKATIPAHSVVNIGEAGPNQGQNFWNGTTLTKSAYDPLTQGKNYTDSFFTKYDAASLLTVKNTVIINTGEAVSSASFDSSDFIPVVGGEVYNLYSMIAGTGRHAWYDKNKSFIAAFGEDQTSLSLKTYTSPSNAYFVRVTAVSGARPVAYLNSRSYVIDKVKKIIEQHAPNIDSSKINYSSSNVKDTLDSVISKQNSIMSSQNGISSQLDLMTDKDSAYFVNTSQFVKAVLTPSNFNIVDVLSKPSDNQMIVSDASAFIVTGSCVVHDSTTDTYSSHNVLAIAGTTITVAPELPPNPSKAQSMYNASGSQHLSLFGYKGLGDYVLKQLQKYSYKKTENLMFNFNPSKFVRQASAQGQITKDGTAVAIPVVLLNGAGSGGNVAGTNNLVRDCNLSNTLSAASNAHTQYLSKAYIIKDSTAGRGIQIDVPTGGLDGFMEIPIVARDEEYIASSDGLTRKTAGRAKLEVYADGVKIHDAIYGVGSVRSVNIDFSSAAKISVHLTCADSVPTSMFLCGIFAYRKSAKTSKQTFFKDGDVIGVLGDSWTQHPVAADVGEPAADYPISNMPEKFQLMYPSGKKSDGTQWISRRIKEKLASQGVNTTVLNVGFGGQTSRWGRYWIDAILTMNPKPTHCILCFYINDHNSIGAPNNNNYDIDPDLMFNNKAYYAGGVNGKIASYAEWEENMKWLCGKLVENNIKPIVMMPSQTASSTQTDAIRVGQLDRIADGLE